MKSLRRSHTPSASSSSTPFSSPVPSSSSPASSSWIHLRSLLIVASLPPVHDRGGLKSPWSRRKRKRVLTPPKWSSLFSPEGKLRDEVKFLKKVRSGGIDPRIRPAVWPFLLGVYDLSSTEAEREAVRSQKRKEYKKLRRRCRRLLKLDDDVGEEFAAAGGGGGAGKGEVPELSVDQGSPSSSEVFSARQSLSNEDAGPDAAISSETTSSTQKISQSLTEEASPDLPVGPVSDWGLQEEEEEEEEDEEEEAEGGEDTSALTQVDVSAANSESSDSESSIEEPESLPVLSATEMSVEGDHRQAEAEPSKSHRTSEDYATWQRIIRLDALRANAEWIPYSSAQTTVSGEEAARLAATVGLRDYDHLEPCRVFHAARLVAVLEAYAVFDPEIGYCQGMSDLLSPIVAVMEEDCEAFWCFVGFMRRARHNFRLDEVGIRRQLNLVSKIIKYRDSQFYRHLEKLEAADCFFVYRMVVVLFRRELSFEQTLCLWEVMWADQAAIRAGIGGKSAWDRIRQRAPPTDNLLLYAIAACVLQRRKLIIERYSSMDEILRECNSMAGQLDVWKLLDDAHDLVVALHDKV
ncbi:unnamed protein product [Spirodela intermedia]|uniref:Rab-GAP TBC domain-containing protein n=1 Tax=Spirodela intermedia TaxID=51605 RepID=A0A7I8K6D6_SPIIN|nr:unnamed protein product [Spirodela intermedia]